MATCTQCGAELKPGTKFCENCGAKVSVPQPGSAELGAGAQLRAVRQAVRQAAVRILLHRNSRRI